MRNAGGNLYFATTTVTGTATTTTTALTILNNGNVGIGTTTPGATLEVNGSVKFSTLANDATGYYMCVNATTGQLATSTTACGASSIRFKENINPLTYGLAEIGQLQSVSFDWKKSHIPNGTKQIGFIAEDMAKIIPEVVGFDAEGEPLNIDYAKLTPVIVNAIKQIGTELDVTKALGGAPTLQSEYQGTDIPAIKIDSLGNAFFAGEITASGFDAGKIETSLKSLSNISSTTTLTLGSIASIVNDLASSTASATSELKIDLEKLTQSITDRATALEASSTEAYRFISLLSLGSDGLSINTPLILGGGLRVDQIAASGEILKIISNAEFTGSVDFIGRPYFTADTAGFAVIKENAQEVEVIFEKEYLNQPIVNATISFEEASTTHSSLVPIGDGVAEKALFDGDVRFVITKKSEKGFTILLNKPAPTQIPFSWTAFAVKSANVVFGSKEVISQTSSPAPVEPFVKSSAAPVAPASSSVGADGLNNSVGDQGTDQKPTGDGVDLGSQVQNNDDELGDIGTSGQSGNDGVSPTQDQPSSDQTSNPTTPPPANPPVVQNAAPAAPADPSIQ
jgi:hypothetical protein